MEAKELMIGDWVKVIKSYGLDKFDKNETIQLTAFEIYKVFEDVLMVEPIPLTPEIFEKNGFELGSDNDSWWIIRNVGVAFRNDGTYNCDISVLGRNGGMDLHIDYVHELQHALRLCNIDKEIKL